MLVASAGTALLGTGLGTPPVTILGLALFDAGCFAAQAANQSRVIALDPERSGSLSSVYLVLYFIVGAVGTALGAPVLEALGWRGACVTAGAALLLAALLGFTGTRHPRRPRASRRWKAAVASAQPEYVQEGQEPQPG